MKMYSLSPTIKSHMAYTCAEGKKVEHEKNICKRLKIIIKRNERKRFLKFLKFYGYFNSDNNTDKKKKEITILNQIYELFTRTKKKKKRKIRRNKLIEQRRRVKNDKERKKVTYIRLTVKPSTYLYDLARRLTRN